MKDSYCSCGHLLVMHCGHRLERPNTHYRENCGCGLNYCDDGDCYHDSKFECAGFRQDNLIYLEKIYKKKNK